MSGWTGIAFKTDNASKKILPKLSNKAGKLSSVKLEADGPDKHIVHLSGYGRRNDAIDLLHKINPDEAVVVTANNTSDSGNAAYFKKEDDKLNKIDVYYGEQGKAAMDAASKIEELYNFTPYTGFYSERREIFG